MFHDLTPFFHTNACLVHLQGTEVNFHRFLLIQSIGYDTFQRFLVTGWCVLGFEPSNPDIEKVLDDELRFYSCQRAVSKVSLDSVGGLLPLLTINLHKPIVLAIETIFLGEEDCLPNG